MEVESVSPLDCVWDRGPNLVGEFVPRAAGDRPGGNHVAFGIEMRYGGHLFQLNFSNGLGTTMGQLARGGADCSDWFIRFNLSRKFF